MKVTALAGGVGGAKLLSGLQATLPPGELTAVVNTGDDADVYGLRVSPDVDIVTYWLAGIADTERGWGVLGDSFTVLDTLARLGHDTWFSLGDRDLATCLHRTMRLTQGTTPTAAADEIRRALGIPSTILPMTDDEVRTVVVTAAGETLDFQTYFVARRHEPSVADVRLSGIERAAPAPGVLEAIAEAATVVICPSNPVLSVAPILGLPGVRGALRTHPRVVAVTPLVGGRALKGPADRLLADLGIEPSASGVASLYADFCDLFVVDATDPAEGDKVAALGIRELRADTIMTDQEAAARLAKEVVA